MLTLGITRVLERETLEVSIQGSRDGSTESPLPVAWVLKSVTSVPDLIKARHKSGTARLGPPD